MRVLVKILLVTLLGGPASLLGQSLQENRDLCKSHDPEQSIAGCSALIESGQETGVNLAKEFNNRGASYANKDDYDHAIQDYDQALRLNPNLADAFCGRGLAYADKGDYDRAIADSIKHGG
jgi:tetratricopeptide (TPR) repeat protein